MLSSIHTIQIGIMILSIALIITFWCLIFFVSSSTPPHSAWCLVWFWKFNCNLTLRSVIFRNNTRPFLVGLPRFYIFVFQQSKCSHSSKLAFGHRKRDVAAFIYLHKKVCENKNGTIEKTF